ncbi:MAG: tetratricopeptide repeat protein [Phycisphaerales bacterium]|nr:tetratricopeptide repeat protein [Phycisphaerales bacterium]
MIAKSRTMIAVLAAAWCVAVSPARAQLAPGTDGRANDASNQVGSGGINTPTSSAYFNSANLYITGNVTRGSYFRGVSPIQDSNSLFISLPSSSLSPFQRDATNLSTVLNSPEPWRPAPFYDPSRTVVGVGAIQAGQNLPGSSVPRSTYLVPQPFDAAGLGSAPVDVSYGMSRTPGVLPNSSIYTPQNSPELAPHGVYDRLGQTTYSNPLAQSPIFGGNMTVTRELVQNASGVSQVVDPYALDLSSTRDLAIDPISRQSRTINDADIKPSSDQMLASSPELLSPSALAPRLLRAQNDQENSPDAVTQQWLGNQQLPGESRYAAGRQYPNLVNPLSAVPLPPPGTDFTQEQYLTSRTTNINQEPPETNPLFDLANAVTTIEQYNPNAPAPGQPVDSRQVGDGTGQIGGIGQFDGTTQLDGTGQTADGDDAKPAPEQYDRAMQTVREFASKPVGTLAGTGQSRIDELMRDAEEKVRAGDYYQASTLYELAASMAPDNPLIRLGYANSLTAAGEYVTAVYQLGQAIDEYPAFGFLRLDLNEFVRDPEDLDLRRADLERRLEKEEDYRLRFLLGYIEQYSGFEKFAKKNLSKAAAEAPANSFIARFPHMLEARSKYLPDVPAEIDGGEPSANE